MPFLKFSRDKRGYENYYLFDGKGQARLLFWFRTPPNVKVGRAPFSEDARKMVEAQNPGVHFDWARIMSTPIPSADVEYWRERRRAEKAAKRAAREADAVEAAESADAAEAAQAAEAAKADEPAATAADETEPREDIEAVGEAVAEAETSGEASQVQAAQPQGHRHRRRRRRGRRGGGGGPAPAPPSDAGPPQGGEV